jgi:hypothetical protein
MLSFRGLVPVLSLFFCIVGSVQSQTVETGAVLDRDVASAQTVAYCDLLQHPDKFKNQMIRVSAEYETDFEESVITSPSCPFRILRTWVNFNEHWESRTTRHVRKTISHAKWRVPLNVVFIGQLNADGGYGHLNMYLFLIEVYKVESAVTQKNAGTSPKS